MTKSEEKIFETITKYINENGFSPSNRDIAEEVELSVSTTHAHLLKLREKGYINFVEGMARSITIRGE